MLVLSRKPKESIVINGDITVSVLRVDNDNVRIGIEAPKTVPVMRREIYQEWYQYKMYTVWLIEFLMLQTQKLQYVKTVVCLHIPHLQEVD